MNDEIQFLPKSLADKCRICLDYEEDMMLDLFSVFVQINEGELKSLKKMFEEATGIMISKSDGLNKMICNSCVVRLKDFHILRRQAEHSHRKLLEFQLNVDVVGLNDATEVRSAVSASAEPSPQSDLEDEVIEDENLQEEWIEEETLTEEAIVEDRSRDEFEIIRAVEEIATDSLDEEYQGETEVAGIKEAHENKNDSVDLPIDFDDEFSEICATDSLLENSESNGEQHYKVEAYNLLNKMRERECQYCQKKFRKKSNFINHLRIHTNDKPFRCKHCSKGFTQSSNYRVHLRSHTQERPFVCPICSKSFTRTDNCKLHIQTHSKQQPHVCHLCPKRYSTSAKLKSHVLSHSQGKSFLCHICSKAYSLQTSLDSHLATHTIGKVHVCQICKKAFTTVHLLAQHRWVHVPSERIKCEYCLQTFTRKGNYKAHVQRKHFKKL